MFKLGRPFLGSLSLVKDSYLETAMQLTLSRLHGMRLSMYYWLRTIETIKHTVPFLAVR